MTHPNYMHKQRKPDGTIVEYPLDVLPFGKYEGRKISHLPARHILYLLIPANCPNLDPVVERQLLMELDFRREAGHYVGERWTPPRNIKTLDDLFIDQDAIMFEIAWLEAECADISDVGQLKWRIQRMTELTSMLYRCKGMLERNVQSMLKELFPERET